METPANVIRPRHPEHLDDLPGAVLRSGARRLLTRAVGMMADAFLNAMQELRLPDGHARLVRHGHGTEWAIQTGIGPVPVAHVRVRDCGATGSKDRVRFTSSILPKSARHARSPDVLLPVLYLRGVSTGDLQYMLAALPGRDAPNLSPAVIARLTAGVGGRVCPLAGARSLRAPLRLRLGRRRLPAGPDGGAGLVHARADRGDAEDRKESVGFQVGVRERAQSRRELLVDVKRRGLSIAPEIAVGDGALGFRRALDGVFHGTAHQRCWVHEAANVLDKVPKSNQPAMKANLRRPRRQPTRAAAEVALAVFIEKYEAKYPCAAACRTKDREALLAFYGFPAEYRDHLRSSNPIESVFATVRHRTVRTEGALATTSAKVMVFKLMVAASKTWRWLKDENQWPEVAAGVIFRDKTEIVASPDHHAA